MNESGREFSFTRRKANPLWSLLLAFVCAAGVFTVRFSPIPTAVWWRGLVISYSDIFVIIAAGIGGLGCGIISFITLFAAEFLYMKGDFTNLYSLSTYLIVIIVSARLSYDRFFSDAKKTAAAAAILSLALALCWHITFSVLLPSVKNHDAKNLYTAVSFPRLFLSAVPECAFSAAAVALFFRLAPDSAKGRLGSGWLYTESFRQRLKNGGGKRSYVLGMRIIALSIGEAVLLCLAAILFSNIQTAVGMGVPFSVSIIRRMWHENLQLALTMFCAAIPIAYLFNRFIISRVVSPINEMSFLMERYFDSDGKRRINSLPDLGIHSGDEIEKLYRSLQQMVANASLYLEHILEQEKKSAHLTSGFMLALAKSVDAKDHYTSGHSERVAQYSREIARRMGKTEREQDDIYTMGLLHDIGKIGVSEAIINKNGRLTDEEFAEIKKHPLKGYEILRNVTELPALATGARWHHERYDGRGYPDGLSGDTIPEEARIIAVADAYDAMTSKRAYSDVRPQSQVRAEIERCRGSQFDPKIADIMLSMIDDDKDYRMREGS